MMTKLLSRLFIIIAIAGQLIWGYAASATAPANAQQEHHADRVIPDQDNSANDHGTNGHEECEEGHNHQVESETAHKHKGHFHFEEFMPEGHEHAEGVTGTLVAVFKHTLMVTIFVMIMMLLIEYITVRTGGKWNRFFNRRNWMQIIFAAILGVLPGCMGTYVAVSLYVHRLFSFAALVTAMIATSGDEAFVMISVMPGTAMIIFGALMAIAILSGLLVHVFMKNRSLMPKSDMHFEVHHHDPHCSCFEKDLLIPQLKKISFERALLLFGGISFVVLLLSGELGLVSWTWTKITFLVTSLLGLAMVITVPDHFLTKHLWGHVIRKHFLKVFLWTFAAFLIIHMIIPYLDLEHWLETNRFYILLIAVLIGILPESGPHIIFIFLFLDGNIPLSILLANSIVQDGHGALPLLAESRRSFIAMKAVNLLIGFIVGLAGFLMGW
ncbi:MAG: putative manganese transporter [Bacteroidales bacterium]